MKFLVLVKSDSVAEYLLACVAFEGFRLYVGFPVVGQYADSRKSLGAQITLERIGWLVGRHVLSQFGFTVEFLLANVARKALLHEMRFEMLRYGTFRISFK